MTVSRTHTYTITGDASQIAPITRRTDSERSAYLDGYSHALDMAERHGFDAARESLRLNREVNARGRGAGPDREHPPASSPRQSSARAGS
jgi:hypothetical protein